MLSGNTMLLEKLIALMHLDLSKLMLNVTLKRTLNNLL